MKYPFPFLFVLAINLSAATSYYVDFTDGSAANDGLSTNAPKKAIPTSLAAGDVVHLKSGSITTTDATLNVDGTVSMIATNCTITGSNVFYASGGFSGLTGIGSLKVIVPGEGVYGITSVSSDTSMLIDVPVKHTPLTNVPIFVMLPITIKRDTNWGVGSVTTARLYISGSSCLIIDGAVTNGINIRSTTYGVYANSSGQSGIVLKNLNIASNTTDNAGIYINQSDFTFIDGCHINDIGNHDATLGDDGITLSSCTNATIQNCYIANCGDDGIQGAGMPNGYIQNCTITNTWSNGSHADAIAFNGAYVFEVTIRYNILVNNASPTDWDQVYFHFHHNLVYDTIDWDSDSIGNNGIRYKRDSYGEIDNNIFAYNTYNAIKGYNDAGYPVKIRNNIFWENADNPSDQYDTCEISIAITNGMICDNNIYRRVVFPKVDNKIIDINGTTKTLATFQSEGFDANSRYYTDDTLIFVSQTRSDLKFNAVDVAPQINAGVRIGYLFDVVGVTIGAAPDIGAYEYQSPRRLKLKLRK